MKDLLLVDDSPTMRKMVIASLKHLKNIRIREASSGLDAIEKFAMAKADLMILDLNMPDIHGFEVLKFIRGHHIYKDTLILVLTTRGDDSTRDQVIEMGADAFMSKPYSPEELVNQVQQLLNPDL